MSRIFIICIIFFLFLYKTCSAQYAIQSWSVRYGFDFSKSSFNSDFFKYHFESAPHLYDDFSTFHYDPTVNRQKDPPMLIEFDLALSKLNKSNLLDNIDYRIKLGVASHELGYDNMLHETYYPYYNGVTDVVFRDFYGFTMSCVNGYLGLESIYKSNNFGKNKRMKFGGGLGVQGGITEMDLHVFHLEGYYDVELDVNDEVYGDYKYFFPAISRYLNDENASIGYYKNLGAYVFTNIERAYFKRQNFIIGWQCSFGMGSIMKNYKKPLNYFYYSSNFTFRFLIGKFKNRIKDS